MTTARCSAFESLPTELRSIIYENVFRDQHIRLRKSKGRGSSQPGILSIFFTSKFFNNDPELRAAFQENAVLVLKNEGDWVKFVQVWLSDRRSLDTFKSVKHAIWKVPEQTSGDLSQPSRRFFREVSKEKIGICLRALETFEIHLNSAFKCFPSVKDVLDQQDGCHRPGLEMKDVVRQTVISIHNRRNTQFDLIWEAVHDAASMDRALCGCEFTLRMEVLYDHGAGHWNGNGYSYEESWVAGIMNVRDSILRIDVEAENQSFEFEQEGVVLVKPPCPDCGYVHYSG